MTFNGLFKASNVWHNKCPEHLFTDRLYKANNKYVEGGGGDAYTYTLYLDYL